MTTTNADVMPSDPMDALRASLRRTVSAQLVDDVLPHSATETAQRGAGEAETASRE